MHVCAEAQEPVPALSRQSPGGVTDRATEPRKAPGRKDWSQETARALGRKGGEAKAAKRKLMDSLGLLELEKQSSFIPFAKAAEPWRVQVARDFVKRFGMVDAVVSTMIASAALQLAASRWGFTYAAGRFAANPFDPTDTHYVSGDVSAFVKASKLAQDANASLDAAWAWCERAAAHKPVPLPGVGPPSLEAAFG